jgi:hypothetical protein
MTVNVSDTSSYSLHHQQCNNFQEIQQEKAKESGDVVWCFNGLSSRPLSHVCTTLVLGQESTAHHKVAVVSVNVAFLLLLLLLLLHHHHHHRRHLQRHGVNWGCVSLEHGSILYKNSVRRHTVL